MPAFWRSQFTRGHDMSCQAPRDVVMLRGIIKKDILNGASVTDEVLNIKSRLKKYSIIFLNWR